MEKKNKWRSEQGRVNLICLGHKHASGLRPEEETYLLKAKTLYNIRAPRNFIKFFFVIFTTNSIISNIYCPFYDFFFTTTKL